MQHTHSSPESFRRHVGDLGNIDTPKGSDETEIDVSDSLATLYGEYSVLNRAVVVHAGKDDLGLGGDDESLKTGNAGGRVACGIIREIDFNWIVFVPPPPYSSDVTEDYLRCHLEL
jgi:Cu-Zn family superoxide dismutase